VSDLCDVVLSGGQLVDATSNGKAATWIFYVIIAALMSILGLSVFVVVAWRQVDSSHGCFLSRLLFSFTERFFRRKPETSLRPVQPTPASEERSRLRSAQCAEVGQVVMSSFRLTVPTTTTTVPDSGLHSTTTSDGGSPGRLLANPPELHATDNSHS